MFDMCDKGFFALGAFDQWLWCIVLLNVCVLSEPCLGAHAHVQFVQVRPRKMQVHMVLPCKLLHLPLSSQVSPCILFILSQEAKQWLQLIGKSGGEDNISVMTLHIALNCFIGKMIVLVQFE